MNSVIAYPFTRHLSKHRIPYQYANYTSSTVPPGEELLKSTLPFNYLWPVPMVRNAQHPIKQKTIKGQVLYFLQDWLTSYLSSTTFSSAYGLSYVADLPKNSEPVVVRLVDLISEVLSTKSPEALDNLKPLTTRAFFHYFSQSLNTTFEDQSKPHFTITSISFTPSSVSPDIKPSVSFGPELFSVPSLWRDTNTTRVYAASPTHYTFRWFSNSFCIEREKFMKSSQPGNKNMWALCTECISQGVVMRFTVAVEGTLEVNWKHGEGNSDPSSISPEEEKNREHKTVIKRPVLVTFESPHMSMEVVNFGNGLEAGPWRVADIDNVVERKLFDNYCKRMLLKKQNENSESKENE
ncbi:hypothetical protein HK098_000269 [Nowakowskiella sp. JEL0407]|nr:hypothetical protein HK098_000269 [Nowakowskiella sp. JEL0407]